MEVSVTTLSQTHTVCSMGRLYTMTKEPHQAKILWIDGNHITNCQNRNHHIFCYPLIKIAKLVCNIEWVKPLGSQILSLVFTAVTNGSLGLTGSTHYRESTVGITRSGYQRRLRVPPPAERIAKGGAPWCRNPIGVPEGEIIKERKELKSSRERHD